MLSLVQVKAAQLEHHKQTHTPLSSPSEVIAHCLLLCLYGTWTGLHMFCFKCHCGQWTYENLFQDAGFSATESGFQHLKERTRSSALVEQPTGTPVLLNDL